MADLKVLPLPSWFSNSFNWNTLFNKPQEFVEDSSFPVYSDGWYYDRKKKVTWYCYQGKSYVSSRVDANSKPYDASLFLDDLKDASIRILSGPEAQALQTLINSGFPLPKEVEDAYWAFCRWQETHSFASPIYRSLKKSVRDSKKRFAAFKAQIAVDKKTDGS